MTIEEMFAKTTGNDKMFAAGPAVEKKSVDQRREEKIAAWCDKIREWDWLPVITAIHDKIERAIESQWGAGPYAKGTVEANFELGPPRKLMQRNKSDYSPQEWWVEEYCFDAALRTVAAEHGLTICEYTSGSIGAEKVVDVPAKPTAA